MQRANLKAGGPNKGCSGGSGDCMDPDGRSYKTVSIGNQVWMAENLNVDHFRNGDPIPEINDNKAWEKAWRNKSPAFCYYEINRKIYTLYNWYAVTDPREIAPIGWHIPSGFEWKELIEQLGGTEEQNKFKVSSKLKSTFGWQHDNGTNESGFTAFPDRFRYIFGQMQGSDEGVTFWSTTTINKGGYAYVFQLRSGEGSEYSELIFFHDKGCGLSVRCLRD